MAKLPKRPFLAAGGAHRATRAVVQIHAHGFDDESPQAILDPRYISTRTWGGSGCIIKIDGTEGLILTNTHVVRNAIHLQVYSLMTSARAFSSEIVGMVVRQEPDIAVIRIAEEELAIFREMCGGSIPHVELGDSDAVQRGMQIKAIGYPCGMAEPNVSGGEITNFMCGDEFTAERLVTDAAINPGNSGGPAVNEQGITIGINTSIIVNADNIGFITPINYAKQLLPQLLRSGEARLAHPGASFHPNSEITAKYLKKPTAEGLIVARVYKGGMLDKAGIRRLDVITGMGQYRFDRYGNVVGDNNVDRRRNIFDVVRSVPLGEPVTWEFVRNGRVERVQVEATSAPRFGIDSQPLVAERAFVDIQGLVVQRLSYEIAQALTTQMGPECLIEIGDRFCMKPRLVVTFTVPGSPATEMFFRPSTLITQVNGIKLYDLDDLVAVIAKAGKEHNGRLVFESQQGHIGVLQLKRAELSKIRIQRALEGIRL
ncbi:MAG: trypsin-like peptidase domain-containing protein [Deltaproteobacteria bacterium]|nr:trypsin-like peptidase domain-containing protein [Deltaproteobacteria bacterium]